MFLFKSTPIAQTNGLMQAYQHTNVFCVPYKLYIIGRNCFSDKLVKVKPEYETLEIFQTLK